MSTLQTEYEDTTETINDIVTSGLSSVLDWINIPGGLTKVTSSEAGFAWGYNGDNSIWSCALPCSGNWKVSDMGSYSIRSIQDIASDAVTVYVLYVDNTGNTNLLTTPANRQGLWSTIKVPFGATKIFSTHTYIWAQDDANNKQSCPKPCNMSNWVPVNESVITITSSTNTHLYGKDPQGNPVQTDETLRSGWYPITAFGETKLKSVIGSDDVIYGIDDSMNTLKYDGKTVNLMSTKGYQPVNLTANNNELWMTSVTPGLKGNVFVRPEKADQMDIVNKASLLDAKRDALVKDTEKTFTQQTDIMTVNKQSEDIIKFFKDIFNLDKDTAKRGIAQAGHITEQIRSTQTKLDRMTSIEPVLKIVVLCLASILFIYLFLADILGWVTHILAIIVLGIGSYFIFKSK